MGIVLLSAEAVERDARSLRGRARFVISAEQGRLFLFLPVAAVAGVLVYFNLTYEPSPWLAMVLIATCMVLIAVFWHWPVARGGAILLLFCALGFGRAQWQAMLMPPIVGVPHHAVTVAGRVFAVEPLANGRRLRIDRPRMDGGPPLPRAVRVTLRHDDTIAIMTGDSVRVRALLFGPSRPAYPGGWYFGRNQFFAGLGAVGFAIGPVDVTARGAHGWRGALRRIREIIAVRILRAMPKATGPIATTLLTGFETAIPVRERQVFITAGLAHILAVAGLHIGIVMGALFLLARFLVGYWEWLLLRVPAKVIVSIVAFAGGAAYAALTGFHVPIERSLAMAALVLVGIVVGRRALSLRGLAVAALAVMLIEPQAVTGPSFQMSFSAVLALVTGYEAVGRRFFFLGGGWRVRLGRYVTALAFTSLLAGGASMPFAAYQFQQVQPYYILANLVAVPLTAIVILPLGIAALLLMPVHLEAIALVPMGWGIAAMLAVARSVGDLPHALIGIGPSPGYAVALVAFGLALLGLLRSRLRFVGAGLIGVGLVAMSFGMPPDILLSPTASLIGVRDGRTVRIIRTRRADRFTLEQWRAVFAHDRVRVVRAKRECPRGRCLLDDGRVLYLADAAAAAGGCDGALVVVSPEPLRGACRAPGRRVFDRFSVWRDGAIAVRFRGARVRVTTDRMVQGRRPWVVPWPRWHHWRRSRQ